MACKKAAAKITIVPSNDPRSYRVNSTKGWKPKKTVENAIDEICLAYRKGYLKDQERFHTVKWMQKTGSKQIAV